MCEHDIYSTGYDGISEDQSEVAYPNYTYHDYIP